MKIKIRDLKKLVRENIAQILDSESVDRLKRVEDGYNDSEFDEAIDEKPVTALPPDVEGQPPSVSVPPEVKKQHHYVPYVDNVGKLDHWRVLASSQDEALEQAKQYNLNVVESAAIDIHCDVDRLRRAKDGYGESEFEESVEEEISESTPAGYEKVVKGLKKNPKVDNPWAVANAMKNKGIKPKK